MLNAHFKPLHQWSGEETKVRKAAQFKANYLNTLDLLEYELGKLRASNVVIQIADPEQHRRMRNDGSMTMADKYWPTKPGVILMFESPKGNISMPCDRYNHWRDNLRAIALSLEALRAVDRYGVTRGNEQYRGWAQLEAPKNGMDRDDAAEFIGSLTDTSADNILRSDPVFMRNKLKALKVKYHPDHANGLDDNQKRHRHEMFVRIGQAEEVLCG
jgi:hypothetical protein